MRRNQATLVSSALISLLLGGVPLLSGCGGSTSAESAKEQPAPKSRFERIQRIGENNKNHEADTKKGARNSRPRR